MRWLRAIGAIWRMSAATMLQYRGEIVLWTVWGIVYPAVALAMWNAALRGSGEQSLAGYGSAQFAGYFLLTMIVSHFTVAWDAYEFGYLVRTGRLSPLLLRPILPIWQSIGDNIGFKFITLVVLVPVWLLVGWIVRPAFSADAGQMALGVVATLLAAALNYIWGYNLALLAFWTTRTDALAEFWFGGTLVFGGRLAPLALLPGPLQNVAAVLPFKWIVWFPAALLLGELSATQAAWGLAGQAGWVAGGVVVFRLLWGLGLRRYSAVGA